MSASASRAASAPTQAGAPADSLERYRAKRNFGVTPEPAGDLAAAGDTLAFVIQKHWASRLHYDFRLELDGAMKSWAVPKGPSYDPHVKRMAVQVEDHPMAYNQFEGEIPAGQYGAGKVIIWDEGHWTPLEDPRKGYRDGMLKFELHGQKMRGRWALIRMKGRGEKQPPWLLIKEKDALARPEEDFNVVEALPDSVVPLRKKGRSATGGKRPAAKSAQATAKASASAMPAVSAASASASPSASDPDAPARRPAKASLPGKPAPLPATLAPELATLVDAAPSEPADWIFEMKFDGYRLLSRVEDGAVQLWTRNGHDWTHKLPALAKAIGGLGLRSGWLDGEIVVLDAQGVPSFQALQNAFDSRHTQRIVYYLFDLPFLDGRDLCAEPVETRRALLQQVLASGPSDLLRFSEAFDAPVDALLGSACRMGLEGLIGKRKGSSYETRRSRQWVKLKCGQRQEFVIVGYTDPQGSRVGIGSLLLAVHAEDGSLRYVGNVGSGFSERTLATLQKTLEAHATDKSPLPARTDLDRTAHWVRPELVAEVSFAAWTDTGRVRHAVFQGLREDKPSTAITRETPMAPSTTASPSNASAGSRAKAQGASGKGARGSAAGAATKPRSARGAAAGTATTAASDAPAAAEALPASLRVTHGERVIDPSTGLTKLDLVRYYAQVSALLLEHLRGRPASLVRAPAGIGGELFFQKHIEGRMPGVKALDPALDPSHAPLLEVPTLQAVLSAAQMNVVEFHTWNAQKTAIGKPDRMTFDLDPGEGVPWKAMQQAAMLVRAFLDQLGLVSFCKTSGGKGLHVVVPVRKQHDWDTIKSFSQAIVQHLARTLPAQFVAKSGPKNRVGKIFIDYLRNGFGATTVAAWSARARPGLGVSVPIAWDEVEGLASSAQWTIANIDERLDRGNSPWADYTPQGVAGAMEMLDFKA